jgi:capsular exopolysaccharide synthesis family protein
VIDNQTSSVDLKQVVSLLRRQAWVILACCGFAAGAALGLSSQQQKQFTAQAALLFTEPDAGQNLLSLGTAPQANATRLAQTNLELVSLPVIASDTAMRLGGGTTTAVVQKAIKLQPRGESDVVEIQATNSSPSVAASIANAFANEYIEFRRRSAHDAIAGTRRTVERQIQVLRRRPGAITRGSTAQNPVQATPLQTQLTTLQSRVADLRILESVQTGNAQVVQQATPPSRPSSPKIERDVLVALFGGLLLGLLLALLREQFSRRVTSPQEYATALNAPLVGTIPIGDALGRSASMPHHLSSHEEESFRMLHAALRLSLAGDDAKVVIVTSAMPSEGKSTIALHLAAAAASLGERVLLIDADFHRPGLHRLMRLPPRPGLPDLLLGHAVDVGDVVQRVPVVPEANGDTTSPQMDVLMSGDAPDHAGRLLSTAPLADLIRGVRPLYDRIVVDTAPATIVSDPIALMQRVPGIVLVVARMESVTMDAAERLHRQLTTAGAQVGGVVANFVRGGQGDGYYYAYSGRATNGWGPTDKAPPIATKT